MKIIRLKISAVCVIAVFGICFALGLSARADTLESGWLIEQNGQERGRTIIRVTAKQMIVTNKLISFVVQSPKFDALLFNDSAKKFVLLPHSEWTKRYPPGAEKKIKGPEDGPEIAGFRTKKYSWPTKNRHKTVELWTTKELSLAKPFLDFVSHTTGIPLGMGLPLKMVANYDDRNDRVDLDTRVIKQEKFASSVFRLPKGYAKVRSEVELLLGGDGESGLDAFMK